MPAIMDDAMSSCLVSGAVPGMAARLQQGGQFLYGLPTKDEYQYDQWSGQRQRMAPRFCVFCGRELGADESCLFCRRRA